MFGANRRLVLKGKILATPPGRPVQAMPSQANAVAVAAVADNKWMRRGHVYFGRGDMIGAISAYSQAILENPRNIEALCGRGRAFKATGGLELALRDFNAAVTYDPQSATALALRGGLYYDLSRVRSDDGTALATAAIEDLNRAVMINPNCAEAFQIRALVAAAMEGRGPSETSRGSRAVYDAYIALTLNSAKG